jgi:Fe2+ or Zn2+ uptake regulation protein
VNGVGAHGHDGSAQRLDEEVALRLSAAGQRYTANRRRLVAALAAADRPLTMPELLDADGHRGGRQRVPQSSAYRNLLVLADARVVRRVLGADDAGRYELAEDLAGHHHHLVCESCGQVSDLESTPRLERALSEASRAAAESAGFEVSEHRFDLVGRCAACR